MNQKRAGAGAERLPPQSIDAELSVLGAVLLDPGAILKVVDLLFPADFYRPAHATIFNAMQQLFEANQAIDLVTLKERLQQAGELDRVGGAGNLASLLDGVPTAANIVYHARIVREKSILRQLISTSTEIVSHAFEGEESVNDILDKAEARILEIGEKKVSQGPSLVKDTIHQTVELIHELYLKKSLVTGVATGFTKLDRLTSGLQRSDLIIIAGRPSMGKTSLVMNIAQHVSIVDQLPVVVFSLEMSRNQLIQRILCSEARINAQNMRTGFLTKDDFTKLTRAAGLLYEAPLWIDDSASSTALEIRAKARRLKHQLGNLGLVIIDYLQLMRGRDNIDNRQQEISEISRSLKALAKELDVPVIALSQLSRAVESRGKDRRPVLSDLRESGAIEQDADVVAFIYRDEVYNDDSPDKGVAEIIIRKQRNGPTDTVLLTFLKEYTRFENKADDSYS